MSLGAMAGWGFAFLASAAHGGIGGPGTTTPASRSALAGQVAVLMEEEGVEGLAFAITERGNVQQLHALGKRNASGDPLTPDTVMYGASLTKPVFAYLVLQLAAEGRIDLDRSIADYLPHPLPGYTGATDRYGPWHHLAGDERWRALTPRILLNHSSGFHTFYSLEPDERLRFHFDPGSRYSYSNDGVTLLQFVIEQGLGLDVEQELRRHVFGPFGMMRSSLVWRDDFRADLADGWTEDGEPVPHDERSRVRAAGSLDTTITDMARFSAGVMGSAPALWREMARPQLPIRSASQFPLLQPDAEPSVQTPGLSAGFGVVTFSGPQGPGFIKGGHNEWTGNTWVCLTVPQRCIVLLGNDVRAERLFPRIVRLALGETGAPWRWEYADKEWTGG